MSFLLPQFSQLSPLIQIGTLMVMKEAEFYEKTHVDKVKVEVVLGSAIMGGDVPAVPESVRNMLAAVPKNWLEVDRVYDSIDALRSDLELSHVSHPDLRNAGLVSTARGKLTAKGTQSILKVVLEELGKSGCVIQFRDMHTNRSDGQRWAPDFCATSPSAGHAIGSLIIAVGDAKAARGGFSPANKGTGPRVVDCRSPAVSFVDSPLIIDSRPGFQLPQGMP